MRKSPIIFICGFSLLAFNAVNYANTTSKTITIYGYENANKLNDNHPTGAKYLLQVAALASYDNALKTKRLFEKQYHVPVKIQKIGSVSSVYRVLLGPFNNLQHLKTISQQLALKDNHKVIHPSHPSILNIVPTFTVKATDLEKKPTDSSVSKPLTSYLAPLIMQTKPLKTVTPNKTIRLSPVETSLQDTTVAAEGIAVAQNSGQLPSLSTKQRLLNQVHLGETTFKEELVTQALDRLDRINPNDEEVLAAHIRQSLRLGKKDLAAKQLEQLKKIAPNSVYYLQSLGNEALLNSDMQQQLQNAQILALGGKYVEAKKAYDALFHGVLPTPQLEIEYWVLAAHIPENNKEAYRHLNELYQASQKETFIVNDPNSQRLQDLMKHALSNLLIDEGDLALKNNKLDLAQEKYLKAFSLDNKNSSALTGLGDVALAEHNYTKAEQDYKDALKIESRIYAYYGLVAVYKRQSPQKALDYINTLPDDIKDRMQGYLKNLKSGVFEAEGKQFENQKHWAEAIKKYETALKLTPDDIWLTYRLANAYEESGQPQKGIAIFQHLAKKLPNDSKQVYAYALYLSGIDRNQQAINHIKTLSPNHWTKDIRELYTRLTLDLAITYAQTLRDRGEKEASIAYLSKLPASTRIDLNLADWASEDGQYANALKYYQKVTAREPHNFDAILGEIETYVALEQLNEARLHLNAIQGIVSRQSLNAQRRIGNAWYAVGSPGKAEAIFQRLKLMAKRNGKNQDSALSFRDAARLEDIQNKPELAKADIKQAMVSSGVTPVLPPNNDAYTLLTRNEANDDWLKRGIRSDAAQFYRKRERILTFDENYWTLAGTPGTSQMNALDSIAKYDFPLWNGRGFVRDDYVNVNAGSFVTSNGLYFNNFGTCGTVGCNAGISQTAAGDSIAVGWNNNSWLATIGTTPMGFEVPNVVGAVGYSNNYKHINWTLAALRGSLTNSLLSFAGTTDPNTGTVWGGVVASGLDLSTSYDRGGAHGLWGDLEADYITGKNVANNSRVRLMEGYYYKLINEDNRRATIGLTNMIWHYQTDLSGYTLGQGGYYSPQSYVSFSIPAYYRQRTANWSWEVGGAVSWSTATVGNSLLYPLPNLLTPELQSTNAVQSGSSSNGFGYSLLFLVEHRLTSNFFIGAGFDLQRSTDYTPSQALLYLRTSLDGWNGDMDTPPQPLRSYAYYR